MVTKQFEYDETDGKIHLFMFAGIGEKAKEVVVDIEDTDRIDFVNRVYSLAEQLVRKYYEQV